ncbi:phosphoglycerate kinase [Glutamicibacter soli]|uniref:phosphoglycerate kinase n=1 Tax=Micrococcaceae TaxID=1268 RepID=UPI00063D8A33|nr:MULTISPECIES: phosphoglycerate kinase [unclassified Arthrobacter]ALD64199.1 phosphoglycerate kinase [Arthrobacter sp. LS16]ALQ30542.1 phosphoglycerate kinase [Arthrobacter sp. YC-RL1]KLI88165.1 phosphoglycerate kinase [Arthrobacter sp. YC-RL1]RKS22691.1 phosphoglycerate kinase [Arthrobacter sp. AG1021]
MTSHTLDELLADNGVRGRYVLVRSDLNVPLDGATVTDDGRVRASLPVISKLADAGAKVIVMAHLGRPKGQFDPKYSIAPAAKRLNELADFDVTVASDVVGPSAREAAAGLADGSVLVLENVRFDARETSKIDAERVELAKELAALTGPDGAYVNDAFGAVHRKHASVYDIAALLPSYQGDLVATEVQVLKTLTEAPKRPYVVVLGGSKVSDKLAVIDNLIGKADQLLIGGGMAFTFLKAQGHNIGGSLLEEDQIAVCQEYLQRAEKLVCDIILPVDVVVADKFGADAAHEVLDADKIEEASFGSNGLGLDIGPKSAEKFASYITGANTVFWNGPMGVFEIPAFAEGTRTVAQALAGSEAFSVVGGGDSAAAVRALGFSEDDFGHISTGGGASLEYLEGKTLPGVAALEG